MACPEGTTILIYYNITDFFDLSSIETMYRGELEEDRMGLTALNRLALTNNDQQFFDKLLKRGASRTQEKIQTLSKGIVSAYGFNKIPEATVEVLNSITEFEEDLLYKVTDSGTLTLGSVAVVADDQVYYNGSMWVKDNALDTKYIYYYLDMPANYDPNNYEPLSDKIEEYISIYVVGEWFKRKKYSLDLITEELDILEGELKSLVNYRTSINRPSRTF